MIAAGKRRPETWTYRDKPERKFTGGKAEITFNDSCWGSDNLESLLDRVAALQVVQPNLDYRLDKKGHLVKLVDLLPQDSAGRALVEQPRQDFPLAAQAAYPQDRRRRHRAVRPRARRCGDAHEHRHRRDEDREHHSGGKGRRRGRQRSGLDRAGAESSGRRRRCLPGLVQDGSQARQVHDEHRRAGREERQGIAGVGPGRSPGLLQGRGRGRRRDAFRAVDLLARPRPLVRGAARGSPR